MLKLTEREPRRVYLERTVMMVLLLVPSVFLQGTRSLLVAAVSALSCMIADALCCFLRKIKYDAKDSVVPFWGLAAAMMMPATIPVGLIIVSSVLCVVVGKHLFGDSDNIIFCPPAISAAFLIICYPAQMLYFPRYGDKAAAFAEYTGTLSRSVEYSLNLRSVPSQNMGDIVMGLVSGPIGAVFVGIILICGLCMAFRRSNSALVTLPCLITAGLLAFFFPRASVSGLESVVYELSSEYFVFTTVFLAAEPYRIPQKKAGKIIYGVVLGYTTMMFRFFGQTEGGSIFALLITCALTDSFDRVVENMIYWKKTYLNSFEKSKKQVQVGAPKLTDTQEIMLPEKYRFNTPPIDSKVTRHKRPNKTEEIVSGAAAPTGNPADTDACSAVSTDKTADAPINGGAEKTPPTEPVNEPNSLIGNIIEKLKNSRTKNNTAASSESTDEAAPEVTEEEKGNEQK